MNREQIIQKCLVVAGLATRRGKLIVMKIKDVAMIEGHLSKELKELEGLFKDGHTKDN